MNPYSFIPFSSFLINIVLGSVVLALNPRSKTNPMEMLQKPFTIEQLSRMVKASMGG